MASKACLRQLSIRQLVQDPDRKAGLQIFYDIGVPEGLTEVDLVERTSAVTVEQAKAELDVTLDAYCSVVSGGQGAGKPVLQAIEGAPFEKDHGAICAPGRVLGSNRESVLCRQLQGDATGAKKLVVPTGIAPLGAGAKKERVQEVVAGIPDLITHRSEGVVCIKYPDMGCANVAEIQLTAYGFRGFHGGIKSHEECRRNCESVSGCGGFSFAHTQQLCFLHSAGAAKCKLESGLGSRWWVTYICTVGVDADVVDDVR